MEKTIVGVTPLWDEEKNSYWMPPGCLRAEGSGSGDCSLVADSGQRGHHPARQPLWWP